MKIHYHLLAIIVLLSGSISAQNLIFDNTFNSNSAHLDGLPPQDISMYDQGNLRQLNDSVFIYYKNDVNWGNSDVLSEVMAKTIHQNGSVSVDLIYTHQLNYGFYGPDLFTITDIVTTSNRVFIIRNEAYDDNGTLKKGIYVGAFDYSNGAFMPSSWAGGGGSIQVGPNIFGAKGVMTGTNVTLAFTLSSGTDPIQIASTTVGNVGGTLSYGAMNLVTSNTAGMFSEVADILAVSPNEIYIADNASSSSSSGGNTTYTDMARIIKYNPTTFSLASDYTAGGTAGFSSPMNWNSQSNTPNPQDRITGISYSNGKILVAGYYNHYDGSPYSLSRGRLTRLNANGSLDNTFAIDGSLTGTFAPGFGNDYFRWLFTDIDVKFDGELFISAYGTYGASSPINPVQCFFLKLDADGVLDVSLGNNGKLFESPLYGVIKETIIVQGPTVAEDKFVFNGMRVIDPDPNFGSSESSLNRLTWSTGGTSNLETLNNTDLIISPNPVSSILNIEMDEAATLYILSADGKKVGLLSGSKIYSFDTGSLENGIYFIQTEGGNTYKFIKR